ncbi:MAG: hypothetical protein NTU58_04075 [Candidatus Nealsonbacteria bacterium]|nr:hypothetical protein [Candidatus Nealsonbacteria bacterium]
MIIFVASDHAGYFLKENIKGDESPFFIFIDKIIQTIYNKNAL